MFDVEAVDANGVRCPTFQQRVEFEIEGPAVWRGGYNSGRTNSINHPYLDLECGINRVVLHATRKSGDVTLHARGQGLKPASLTLGVRKIEAAHGYSTRLPLLPEVRPHQERGFGLAAGDSMPPVQRGARVQSATGGRLLKAFSYSGPTMNVGLGTNAQAGMRIYADRDFKFAELSEALQGGDYVQAANDDRLYNAVDLMELAVAGGTLVSVAHDDRLPRPGWLTRQFDVSEMKLTVAGRPMQIFQRRAEREESLTLGANVELPGSQPCNMYVVFVTAAPGPRAGRTERP